MKSTRKVHLLPEGNGITLCGKEYLASDMREWQVTSDPTKLTCKKCKKAVAIKCPKCNKAWDGKTMMRIEGAWTPTCGKCKTPLYGGNE